MENISKKLTISIDDSDSEGGQAKSLDDFNNIMDSLIANARNIHASEEYITWLTKFKEDNSEEFNQNLKTIVENQQRKAEILKEREEQAPKGDEFKELQTLLDAGNDESSDESRFDPTTKLTNEQQERLNYLIDHLLEDAGVFADEKMTEEEINALLIENKEKLKCPKCGSDNFSESKNFNLLVQSNLGNFTGNWSKEPTYLRGETCQGIYINFKNVLDSTRVKVPFGIAQIGKAFRNEITARQFIFRKREFEQMEMQMFVHPDDAMEVYEQWREKRWQYYIDLGIKKENLACCVKS